MTDVKIGDFYAKNITINSPVYAEGYMAGMDDPGMATRTQPESIENPHPEGSKEALEYEAGYRAAIN